MYRCAVGSRDLWRCTVRSRGPVGGSIAGSSWNLRAPEPYLQPHTRKGLYDVFTNACGFGTSRW